MQIGLKRQARQRFICVISQLDGVITASITTGANGKRSRQGSSSVLCATVKSVNNDDDAEATAETGCWKLDIPLKCSIIDCSNGSRAWEFINLHVRPIFVTQFECQKVKFQTKTQRTHSGLDDNVADRYFMFPRKHITIFIFITVREGRQTVPEVQCTCK